MSKYKFLLLALFFVAVLSCEKTEIPLYKQNAGIFFSATEYSYTFIDDPSLTQKTIKLPVKITGNSVDYDREFSMRIPEKDTISTAESDQYSIGKGVIPAGEFDGLIEFNMKYDKRLDDSIYIVRFEITPSIEFPESRLNKNSIKVSFTKKIIKPANWSWLRWYFGAPYSTAWWKFIMEKTGRTSLPYFPTNSDKETWWMSVGEVQAYQSLVRLELEKYNSSPKGPLLHDDGPYANQRVTMP